TIIATNSRLMNATSVPASGGIASSLSSHFGEAFMRHIRRLLPTRCFVANGDRRCAAEILHRDGLCRACGSSEGDRDGYIDAYLARGGVYLGHPRLKVHSDLRCRAPVHGRVRP